MKVIDSNLIIRYLTSDDLQKARAVKKMLGQTKELLLTDVVLAEIIWVLTSYYKFSKEEIIEQLYALIMSENISCNKKLLRKALNIYEHSSLPYIDAYLVAICEENQYEGICSFDQHFDKVKTVKRFEP